MAGPIVRALSTALPREEIVYGNPVMTSIVRAPVAGPVRFGPNGPENNRTAVHVEHVLAFASEHYDYWARELGVLRDAWPWAFWGENLTLDGLDETRLRIGDHVRCGEVVFEVSGPRTPCYKLSWRLGQDVGILRRLSASGLVGVYLRVVTPGSVRAGDEVAIAPMGRTGVTVAEVARMIGDLGAEELPTARAAMAVRELGDTSRQALGYRVNHLEDLIRVRQHRWQGWRPFRIAELRREGRDAMSVALVAEDGAPIAPFRAGQHISVRLPGTPSVVRTWSLSDFEPHPTRYRITVRRQEGPGSRWLNDVAQVGDVVEVRAPAGRFVLDRSSFHRVVLISAGIGMTPLLSMLRAHVGRGADAPAVHWLQSTSDWDATFHAGEVDALLRQFARATRQVHVTGQDGTGDRTGRITHADLAEILRTPFPSADGAIVEPGRYSHFYVCGPKPFNAMVVEALRDLGVPEGEIFTEIFSAERTATSRTRPARVTFAASGISVDWNPDEDLTLLELAEAAGIDAPFSCRAGRCGACAATLLSGTLAYDPAPEIHLEPPTYLTCCTRPATHAVSLDL